MLAACSTSEPAGSSAGSSSRPAGDSAPAVEQLTVEQLRTAVLALDDLPTSGSFAADESDQAEEETSGLGCLDGLAGTDDPDVRDVDASFSDGFFTNVLASAASYRSVEDAAAKVSQLRDAVDGCDEVDTDLDDGGHLTGAVSVDGQADTTLRVSLNGSVTTDDATQLIDELPFTVVFDIARVDNNLASTAVIYAGESTDADIDVLSTRAVEKLNAVTRGEAVPPGEVAQEAQARQLAFGDSYTGERSVLTVSAPQALEPSDTAALAEGGERAVVVEVSLQNTGADVINAYDLSVSATANGADAPEVYDSEQGIDNSLAGDVLPGRTNTFRFAVSLPAEPVELVVSAALGLGDSVYFVGTV